MATWSVWDLAPAALTSLFAAAPARRPAFLLMGDSITEFGTDNANSGWISLLQHRYNRSVDMVCRGLAGYNTKWTVEHVSPVIEQELEAWLSPVFVTVWLGANDATLPDGPDKVQHVPLDNYRTNLLKIAQGLQSKAPNAKILFITPPHVDDSRRNKDRSNASAGQYARACVETGTQAGVPTLDLHSFFNAMPAEKRNGYLIDGLHFNASGNMVVDELIRAAIHEHFPDLVPVLEKWQFPDWHEYAAETTS